MNVRLRVLVMCCCLTGAAVIALGMAGCKDRPPATEPASESAGEETPSDAPPASKAEISLQRPSARAMMRINKEILPRALADLDSMSLTLSPAGPGSEGLPSLWLGVGQPPDNCQGPYQYQATISREQAAMIVGYLAGDGLFCRSWFRQSTSAGPRPPKGAYYDVRVGGDQWSGADTLSLTPVAVMVLENGGGILTSKAEQLFFGLRNVMGIQVGQTLTSFIREFRDRRNPEAQSAQPRELSPSQRLRYLAQLESVLGPVESLLSNLATFEAEFNKEGTEEEIYRSLHLSVRPPSEIERPSVLTAQLTPIQAAALAGYLMVGPGFEVPTLSLQGWPSEPFYSVGATSEGWGLQLYHNAIVTSGSPSSPRPGLRVPTLEFLMFLRGGLVGEAGEAMDELLQPILEEQ